MFVTNTAKYPEQVVVTVGTMDDVVAGSAGEQGDRTMDWKPSMELYCKNKPAWLRIEGLEKMGEMVGFPSEEGEPSGS